MKLKPRTFFIGGMVLAAVIILFILSYVIIPVFSYSSVPIPVSCIGTVSHLPRSLDYTIPTIGTGTLLTDDPTSAVVVMADYGKSPLTSTVFLIRKSDNKILRSFIFNNDIVDAGIANGTLYLYNDKIGYFLDVGTGGFVHYLFTIDNYRGLYMSNHARYLQTTLEISGLRSDGGNVSHLHVDMKSIAFGCLISD